MDEAGYVRSVHRKLPDDIYIWKINCRYANGVPDAWYRGWRGDIFIEYKFVVLPAKPTTVIRAKLSRPQYNWLVDRAEQGVRTQVVIGSDHGGVWFDTIDEAYDGIPCEDFIERMRSPAGIAKRISLLCGSLNEE